MHTAFNEDENLKMIDDRKSYVRAECEVVVIVLKFLGGRKWVADFDVVGQERITIVVNPIEHLKNRKVFVIDGVTQIWAFLTTDTK